MNTLQLLELLVCILLIGGAISCVVTEKIIVAVIRLSLLSMLAVIAFALMRAPDVAVTEAVIGSGLVTFVFIMTVKEDTHEKNH